MNERVEFPITVTFEDGSSEPYLDVSDIECNLEDCDSTADSRCSVADAKGQKLRLVVKLLRLVELRPLASLVVAGPEA